ncbi:hypothetical protein I7F99_26140 [Bacillus cereus]|nr:hypothetical protein [Bacillus cereus]
MGIDNANEALKKSFQAESSAATANNIASGAKDQAKEANRIANNVQEQLDTIVVNGDSSVEAAQARVDTDGNVSGSLKGRLDKDFLKLFNTLLTKSNLFNDKIAVMNKTTDTVGVVDFANFAGQGTALKDIMAKLHNYTDSDMVWIDNVGEGNVILRLNNANNSTRRKDKPADYVGKGKFLQCGTKNVTTGTFVIELEVDVEGNVKWGGPRDKPATFSNDKGTGSTPAFVFRTPSKLHDKVLQIRTMSSDQEVFSFGCHQNGTIAEIDVGSTMTGGLSFNLPPGATIQVNGRSIPTVRKGAFPPTSIAPESDTQIFVDTLNNKVYMAKGINVGDWILLN